MWDYTEETYTFTHLGIVHTYLVRSERSETSEIKPPPPQDALDLKAELEMPPEAVWRRFFTNGVIFGDRWRDYELMFFGMLADDCGDNEVPGLLWRITDKRGHLVENIQLWYQSVSHKLSPVCCELRWHPDRGQTINFTGLENATRERDITLAWRGKALLSKVARLGRPANSFNLSEPEFMERAPKAFGKWVETFGEEPTDVQLAEELGISRATFYRYLKSYNLSIQQLRAKGNQYSS